MLQACRWKRLHQSGWGPTCTSCKQENMVRGRQAGTCHCLVGTRPGENGPRCLPVLVAGAGVGARSSSVSVHVEARKRPPLVLIATLCLFPPIVLGAPATQYIAQRKIACVLSWFRLGTTRREEDYAAAYRIVHTQHTGSCVNAVGRAKEDRKRRWTDLSRARARSFAPTR